MLKQFARSGTEPRVLEPLPAGFACQPFSLLGDQRGGEDMRAQSLRGILQIAFLAQVQVVILECVTPAATNQFVRDEIQRFLDVSGFSCSQTELQLSDVWPSKTFPVMVAFDLFIHRKSSSCSMAQVSRNHQGFPSFAIHPPLGCRR